MQSFPEYFSTKIQISVWPTLYEQIFLKNDMNLNYNKYNFDTTAKPLSLQARLQFICTCKTWNTTKIFGEMLKKFTWKIFKIILKTCASI